MSYHFYKTDKHLWIEQHTPFMNNPVPHIQRIVLAVTKEHCKLICFYECPYFEECKGAFQSYWSWRADLHPTLPKEYSFIIDDEVWAKAFEVWRFRDRDNFNTTCYWEPTLETWSLEEVEFYIYRRIGEWNESLFV